MEFEKKIHPTALIHNKSKLHSTVKVGAYSVIGEGVKIGKAALMLNIR